MVDDQATTSRKGVTLKGDVLNDNGMDVDYLGREVYADALVNQIKRIQTPVTIGLFARWGSGKSFLLKKIQNKVIYNPKTSHSTEKELPLPSLCLAILFLLFGALPVVFVIINLTEIGIVFLFLFFFLLLLFFSFRNDSENEFNSSRKRFSKVVLHAFFKKLSIKPDPASEKRRFIFVDFTAWEYAGCDVLWAGIVKTLAEKVETEFGIFTTRLFRSINLKTINSPLSDDRCWDKWRWNNIGIAAGFLIAIGSSIAFLVLSFISDVFLVFEPHVEVPVEIKILGVLPGGFALLFVVGRMGFAFIYSQENRITSALLGAKKNLVNELGFLSKIKDEVDNYRIFKIKAITNLVHAVKEVYETPYKIVITVDDLDRVPLSKVKSVLESVNILLSDGQSPFFCIIAIDPRVAVDCFAMADGCGNVNGHEYLKKIINLPFCFPEIDDDTKKKYIDGLIHEVETKKPENSADAAGPPSGSQRKFDHEEFVSSCRRVMYEDEVLLKHMQGNPRNMKRIFNVISVTASLIESLQERQPSNEEIKCQRRSAQPSNEASNQLSGKDIYADDIVYWIVLTDQWPFRMSYILVIIESDDHQKNAERIDKNQAIEDNDPLCDMLKYDLLREKDKVESYKQFLCLDGDPNILYSLLKESEKFMTKDKAKKLLKYTINLDRNVKQSIAAKRAAIDK